MNAKNKTAPRAHIRILALSAYAFLAAALLAAAAPEADVPGSPASPYSVESSIDWEARILSIRLTLDLQAAGLRLPAGRLEAERMAERDLPALAKEHFFAVRVDSRRDVEDTIADGTILAQSIISLPGNARLASSSLTKDLRGYAATYMLPLDSVAALYLDGSSPAPTRSPVDAVPTRDYSGIVIYAKGSLPVRGERIAGRAAPCLFPRIYDDSMRLILDRSMVASEALASRGVLGYADGLGAETETRAGGDPLRIMAVEIFGDGRTDYVIRRSDAQRILSSAANRELLRQGKVVVILDF